jgi:hypothetical protein
MKYRLYLTGLCLAAITALFAPHVTDMAGAFAVWLGALGGGVALGEAKMMQ